MYIYIYICNPFLFRPIVSPSVYVNLPARKHAYAYASSDERMCAWCLLVLYLLVVKTSDARSDRPLPTSSLSQLANVEVE